MQGQFRFKGVYFLNTADRQAEDLLTEQTKAVKVLSTLLSKYG